MAAAALLGPVESVINRALEKDRNLRYQTASDLRADLQRLRRDTQSSKIALGSGSITLAGDAAKSRKWPMLAAAAVVILLGVLGLGYFLGWFSHDQPYSEADLKPQQLTTNSSEDPVAVSSVSPDGKYLLYADLEGLHLRLISTGETQSLPIPDEFCFR